MKNIIALIVFLFVFTFGYGQTTWDGAAWSAGAPTIGDVAIINGNYFTNGTNGSFSALSVTVNAGFTLTINDGFYIEVQNNIIADGDITVQSQGTVVQINDAATVTGTGTIKVVKAKTMQNWDTYTYWSSPMNAETIEQALGVTPVDRRFKFEAVNFVDMLEEVGNTGVFLNNPGIDDIDDDGNDWQAFTTGTMEPGRGYATTASEIVGPGGYPSTESFIFTGTFNNGQILVSLINNSTGVYNDWNFIGNPYPSAISTDLFFAVNSTLVDVIYLWDQATDANSNNSGNQGANFSVDDYAMINGVGGTGARGGTGNIPNKFISSGQGFFVEALLVGNVTFNNSMRVTGNNDQFFRTNPKSKSEANKLWVNLSSDNGVFNQILVGYVVGATNGFDRTYYDAPRNLSAGTASVLYTTIEGNNKKFAIQGKAINDLSEDEIINIGFKTIIDVPTIYTLSIAQLEGEFLNGNPVYLKDNLLNTSHDLKASDYNFTSEVGEFNERFEIVFNEDALSLSNQTITVNDLSIIELQNGDVQFKLSGNTTMATIQIIDLQGRIIYNLQASGNTKTYNLSNLSQTPYIAKVTLANGSIITKKAIKRY